MTDLYSNDKVREHAERIVRTALARLNDFVGYRPVPVLELTT